MTHGDSMLLTMAMMFTACAAEGIPAGPATPAEAPALPEGVSADELSSAAERCVRSEGSAGPAVVAVRAAEGAPREGLRVVHYVPERARWEVLGETNADGAFAFTQDGPSYVQVLGSGFGPKCLREKDGRLPRVVFRTPEAVRVPVEVRGPDGAVLAEPPGLGIRHLLPPNVRGDVHEEPPFVIPAEPVSAAWLQPFRPVEVASAHPAWRVACVALASDGGCPDGAAEADALTLPRDLAADDTLVVRFAVAEVVEGVVWSTETGGPLQDAEVRWRAEGADGWPRWTGADGRWTLPRPAASRLHIDVQPAGHSREWFVERPLSFARRDGTWLWEDQPLASFHGPIRLVAVEGIDLLRDGTPHCRDARDPGPGLGMSCLERGVPATSEGCLLPCPANEHAVVEWSCGAFGTCPTEPVDAATDRITMPTTQGS